MVLGVASLVALIFASKNTIVYNIAAFYFIDFIVLGPLFLLMWIWSRWRALRTQEDISDAAEADQGEDLERVVDPDMGAIGLGMMAATLAVISFFLPRAESTVFHEIASNTLIQSGVGWLILGFAVGIIGGVYRAYSQRSTTWTVLVLGIF